MAGIAVAAVGDNCIDRYLAARLSTVGGNAVNVAVQLARLGLAASCFTAVGNDDAGVRVRAALGDNRVDIGGVRIADGRTASTDIGAGPGGERIIAFEEMGVCAGYRPDEDEIAVLRGMRHVHIGWLDDGGAVKAALAVAGGSVSQDLSVTSPAAGRTAAGLAVAFASAGDSIDSGEALVARLLAEGARLAVATCGSAGSVASDGRSLVRAAAHPVAVLDTLGAGDAFFAGFIAARLAGLGLADCLDKGSELAAETCRHLGGFPQTPEPIRGV